MKHFRGFFVTIMALWLLGCASTGPLTEVPTAEYEPPLEEYMVGVGDDLQINVWKNPELSLDVPVRPDGKISMPLIGDIQAAGRSAPELAQFITTGLKDYIRSPQVTVIVKNAGSIDYQRRVRISGAVENPVSLPFRDGMTVLDLVLEAGGLNQFASANNAKLYRTIGGKVKVYSLHLDDILNRGKLESNYRLAPSDIITVPERIF